MLLSTIVDATDGRRRDVVSRSRRSPRSPAVLRELAPDEIAPAIGFLTASPRQGRIGVGWRGLSCARRRARRRRRRSRCSTSMPSLSRLAAADGAGSVASRKAELDSLADAGDGGRVGLPLARDPRRAAHRRARGRAARRRSRRRRSDRRRPCGAPRCSPGDLGETARHRAHRLRRRPRVRRPRRRSPGHADARLDGGLGRRGARDARRRGIRRIQARRRADPGAPRGATRCASTPATSPTSPIGCPRSSTSCGRLPLERVILDGETLSLDEDGAPRPFQDTMSRFGSEGVAVDRAAAVVLRHPASRRPRPHRRAARDPRSTLLEPVAGESRMPGIVTDDPGCARRELSREALAAGHEGVMIKAIDSTYAAGRRGKSWIKVKPVLTFDLVVLAVEWGSGRRTGQLSNLHLGARDPDGRVRRTRRLRHGRQDLQGPHRRAAALADRALPDDRDPSLGLRRPCAARDRRRDRDRRGAALVALSRAASRCASPASRAIAPTRRPPEADTIGSLIALLR